MEDYERHYSEVTKGWKFGSGELMQCPNPDCDCDTMVVEPFAFVGGFHGEIHNLRARCRGCNSTLGIVVKPVAIVNFGNGTETVDPRPVLELMGEAYAAAPVKMKEPFKVN